MDIFLRNNSNNDKSMSTIWPTWVSSRGSQLAFCARPIRFPERGQIFRRRQERAINRRPEKLMNNTRRRESGHSRRRPMVSIYFRAPIRYSTRTQSLVVGRLHPTLFAAQNVLSLLLPALWTFVTFGGSYQSADVAVTPKCSPRRWPDCVIDFRCLLSSHSPTSRSPLRSASLWLDGVKCAPLPTRAADFSSYVYQLPSVTHIVK